MPQIAYKVLLGTQMAELELTGRFAGAPIDLVDGYIHMSTAAQLVETVDKHFNGFDDLHIVAVDLEVLGEALRWEPSRGGQLFPHLYGELTLDEVIAFGPLERGEHGAIRLPTAG